VDAQHDERDVEFEAFLRQFQPRAPVALRRRFVTPRRLAIAAAVALACAVSFQMVRGRPAAGTPPPANTARLPESERPVPAASPGAPTPAGRGAGPLRATGQGGPVRVGGSIKPPRRLVNVNPVYPEDAKAAGIEGVVILEITIAEDGKVSDARVVSSVPALDQAAIDAVVQWVYEPTLLNGAPVEVLLIVTINFTLQH
jgi:TonB family protein